MNQLSNQIIAHRGESFDAPENTMQSIQLAWDRNCQLVEIDIRKTKDNQIVIIHDKTTYRTAKKLFSIKRNSLEVLKKLNVGYFKHSSSQFNAIPALKEVLESVPKDCKLVIEIKSNSKILSHLKKLLEESNFSEDQIHIIAFNFKTLAKAKRLMPQYKMLWLLNLDYYFPSWLIYLNKEKIVQKLKKYNLDGVNVWQGKLLTKEFIQYFKQKNFLVYTWTVNDPYRAGQLLNYGIDGITTDKAGWLKKQVESLLNKGQSNG